MGSIIINSLLICQTHIYFMLHNMMSNSKIFYIDVLVATSIFIIRRKENCNDVVTVNRYWHCNGINNSQIKNEIPHSCCMWYSLIICNELSFFGRWCSYSLFITSLRHGTSIKKESVKKCGKVYLASTWTPLFILIRKNKLHKCPLLGILSKYYKGNIIN